MSRNYFECDTPEDFLRTLMHFQLSLKATYASLPINIWTETKRLLSITVIPDYDQRSGTVYFLNIAVQGNLSVQARYYPLRDDSTRAEFYFYTLAGSN